MKNKVLPNELVTGIESIDNQHIELFVTIDNIFLTLNTSDAEGELERLFDFLINYTEKHFKAEEKEMLKHHYPYFTEHKMEHENFKNSVTELKDKKTMSSGKTELIRTAINEVRSWLVNHVLDTDIKMAIYLKNKL